MPIPEINQQDVHGTSHASNTSNVDLNPKLIEAEGTKLLREKQA
ncbi:hypothetical protein [Heyndrickxia acidicola]|uniref:Uncharacterized protein n=1 Tax=Heyndrickxia acidicola TaxID=209389 RepID=A0ABU6MIC3_9BACI|nr:hypothetical protein [Heyndrickxia acidicola]MED1204428.1 hypothetical protein [Heyndrickxia acidicola]